MIEVFKNKTTEPEKNNDLSVRLNNFKKLISEAVDDREAQKVIGDLEVEIAKKVATTSNLDFVDLVFLGEAEQERRALGVDKLLAETLERTYLPSAVISQLTALSRSDNEVDHVVVHKILDFIESDVWMLQNMVFSGEEKVDENGNSFGEFSWRLVNVAGKETEATNNYLLSRHWRQLYEMVVESEYKEGAIPGITGGASDETIYTYQHLKESYDLRVALGVRRGYPIANPVLPVAPGYVGSYAGGKLKEVFPLPVDFSIERGRQKERDLIAQNHAEDDHIYNDIISTNFFVGQNSHPSNKLEVLRDLWEFRKYLASIGRKFFYDLERLPVADLHPLVVGEMMTDNQKYLREVDGDANDVLPLSVSEYQQKLAFGCEISAQQEYNHRYLMRLGMRKVVEDDFNIDLASIPFSSQVHFLDYLNSCDLAQSEKLKDILRQNSDQANKILVSFLACADGGKYSETILKLAGNLDSEQVQAVFGKYAEIVEAAEGVGDYLASEFGVEKASNAQAVSVIVRGLLDKGRELLVRFSQSREVETLARDLDDYNTELLLLKNSFKALKEQGPVSLAELKNFSFNKLSPAELVTDPEVVKQMRLIYERNYAKYPEELRESLLKTFDESLADQNNRFYILKRGKDVASFGRFTDKSDGKVYAGAFNVAPWLQQAKIGEAVLEGMLDLEAQNKVLEADCNPNLPMSQKYLEKGFVAVGYEPYQGSFWFKIERDDKLASRWLAKKKTLGELEQLAGHQQKDGLEVMRISDLGELVNYHYQFEAGKVLSRYFQSGDFWYLVFEPQPAVLQQEAAQV